MKITKTQLANLQELMRRAVPTSEWTTGLGRHTKIRAIPPFCGRISRKNASEYPLRIQKIFNSRPRVQAVIAVIDMRAAKRAIRG
jgi:hypothetical protein